MGATNLQGKPIISIPHKQDYKMYRNRKDTIKTVIITIIVISILVAFCTATYNYFCGNPQTVYREVVDKAVKNGTYMVYTKDLYEKPYTYEIVDRPLHGKFNSSDIYASIAVGEYYQIQTTGRRIPFLSLYPNINSVILISTLD